MVLMWEKILGCFQCKTNTRNFLAAFLSATPRLCFPFGFVRGCREERPLSPGNRGEGCPPGSLEEPAGGKSGLVPAAPQGTHHRPREPVPALSLVKHFVPLPVPAPLTGVLATALGFRVIFLLAHPSWAALLLGTLVFHSLCTRSPVQHLGA